MNPQTGLPESIPINVTGEKIMFAIVYISPNYYYGTSAGSDITGAGTYIDNAMLTISGAGGDGWRTIIPGQNRQYYGISSNGINYLGFAGSPTHSIIADYNNNSGYPSYDSSLWDNLVTPPVQLINALNATLNFEFKANIAQGLYGFGWPGDMFQLSVSTGGVTGSLGSSWSQIYSPPSYPTPIFAANGGQSGGGTAYESSTGQFLPANGANSTFWLGITLNLNSFVGQTILLDYQIITNNGWGGESGIFIPWHAVGYNNYNANEFLGFYMTNIYIQGYTTSPYIAFSSLWV